MHSYLKTVGFSQITRRSEIKEIIRDVIASYDEKVCVENHPEGVFVQFSKNYGCDCGISVCGQYDENGEFHVEYYFPFFRGTGITSREKVTVERHTDKESYAGACDDLRIGVTMIFYLQNLAEYMQEKYKGLKDPGDRPVTVSGLASEGKILFPLQKDDVLTIVDSYFMPYGIECDQYNVLGEILDIMKFKNILTGEEICQMTIESNDIQFDICINKKNLLGEPEVGRRFRGNIWLQGQIHF